MNEEIKTPDVVDIEWAKKEMERTGKNRCNKDFIYYIRRGTGEIDWVVLGELPKKIWNSMNSIDWSSIDNNSVIAQYKGQKLNVTVIKKIAEKTIVVRLGNNIVNISTDSLKKCHLGSLTGGRVVDYRYNKGDIINNHEILERVRIKSTTYEKGYKVRCILTDTVYEITEYILKDIDRSKYSKRLFYTHPHLVKYFKDKEITKNITYGSSRYYTMVCPNCKEEKSVKMTNLYHKGFSCSNCSDYISFPEKLTLSLLTLNNIKFIKEYTMEGLKQNKSLRFDFYLPEEDIVIEVHGRQHYEDGWGDLNTQVYHDKVKEEFCINRGTKYIVIDARESNYNYIIGNIKKTPLNNIITNYNKEEVLKTMEKYSLSKHKLDDLILDMYLRNYKYIEIEKELEVSYDTIVRALKRRGMYAPIPLKYASAKKVRCITTGAEFKSIREAIREYQLPKGCKIGMVCQGKRLTAGSLKGVPLTWEYVD